MLEARCAVLGQSAVPRGLVPALSSLQASLLALRDRFPPALACTDAAPRLDRVVDSR